MASWEERTKEIVGKAVLEAVERERGRCLWILDQLIEEAEAGVRKKLLIEKERHATEVKLRLARVIVANAKRGIVSGLRPPEAQGVDA